MFHAKKYFFYIQFNMFVCKQSRFCKEQKSPFLKGRNIVSTCAQQSKENKANNKKLRLRFLYVLYFAYKYKIYRAFVIPCLTKVLEIRVNLRCLLNICKHKVYILLCNVIINNNKSLGKVWNIFNVAKISYYKISCYVKHKEVYKI